MSSTKEKKKDRRRCKISTKDKRILTKISNQSKFEQHDEYVKGLEAEMRNISGESRRPSSTRSSLNSSKQSPNGSIDISIGGEISTKSIQFLRDKSEMYDSIKDRLKKARDVKRVSITPTKHPIDRDILGNAWNEYRHITSTTFDDTVKEEMIVDFFRNGEEHPRKKIKCVCCSNPIPSTGTLVTLPDDQCMHSECLKFFL